MKSVDDTHDCLWACRLCGENWFWASRAGSILQWRRDLCQRSLQEIHISVLLDCLPHLKFSGNRKIILINEYNTHVYHQLQSMDQKGAANFLHFLIIEYYYTEYFIRHRGQFDDFLLGHPPFSFQVFLDEFPVWFALIFGREHEIVVQWTMWW